MTQAMEQTEVVESGSPRASGFGIATYFKALQAMIISPGKYYASMNDDEDVERHAFKFLLISGVFYASIYLTYFFEHSFSMAAILLINALGMPVLLAGFAFMVQTMTSVNKISFRKMFAVFAYATGVTMAISWIPALNTITEIWKFSLVTYGLVKGCGLTWSRSIVMVLVSIGLLLLFFWSVFPVINELAH